MSDEPAPISPKARHALEQELAEIRAERVRVAATLTDSDPPGDNADQADELQRAGELGRLDSRIQELTERLDGAATAGPPDTDVVGMGSTVTVRFDDGGMETVDLGLLAAAGDHTLATADSPMGRALLGHRVGDTVSFHAPSGRSTAVVVSLGEPSDQD
ncbi:MAG: GreA/GreB family elongation factor [Stackebrandtia sp.]